MFQALLPEPLASATPTAGKGGGESPLAIHERLMLWLTARAGGLEVEGTGFSRYATALGALGVATVVRWLLDPLLESRAPYGIYLMAVLFVVWRAGLGPALVAVFGGVLLGRYFFDPPRGTLWPMTESNQTAFTMSLSIGILAAIVCESLRVTARDNRRLYDLARQADARKDEFLATLAHELRNPLTPIHNAVYLLDALDSGDPHVPELHQMIGRHTEHLIRLVNDLLDLSRITRRKIELRCETVDLQSIVAGAVEAVQPLIAEKHQELNLALPTDKVYLHADSVRLTQVVTNLLHNAAKYTGVEGRIWLSAEADRECVVLRVRDTGIGIAPEMCDRVFELFEQAHQGIENSYGGLGIGLTLVRSLVQLHGGTVEANSPGLGLGSEFVVRLPISEQQTVEPPASSADCRQAAAAGGQSLRVLIVDDSPTVAATLEMVLADWQHVVHVCGDGFAALEAARTFDPDVVLADLGMPRMSGYQLAEELRRQPGMQSATLIAVSGYGQEADRERSRAVGFVRHLVKPVNLAELREVLAACERRGS